MRYSIFSDALPGVTIICEAGETLYARTGAMTRMMDAFEMKTTMRGGLIKGLGRVLTGGSLFLTRYTARLSGAEITFRAALPGSILAFSLDGHRELICRKNAFLCAGEGIELALAVNTLKAGLFGGEGFIMQRIKGRGLVFLELDGTVTEKTLAVNERLWVDTGSVAAFESSVRRTADTGPA